MVTRCWTLPATGVSAFIMVRLVFFSLFVVASVSAKVKLDSMIPLCSKTDPNVNECVKKSANAFLPYLVKGIRDFGFPPVDPLKIPFLGLSQSDGPVGLKLNISDTVHEGVSISKITDARVDLKNSKMEIDMLYPRYTITGICDLGGRILLLPISGHGPCNLTSNDMDVFLTIKGKPTPRNGKHYIKTDNIQVKVKFHKGSFQLEGLFGGNKELGATMNRFLNENAVEVLNEMKGTLESVWSELFGGLINRLFDSIPIEELYKP